MVLSAALYSVLWPLVQSFILRSGSRSMVWFCAVASAQSLICAEAQHFGAESGSGEVIFRTKSQILCRWSSVQSLILQSLYVFLCIFCTFTAPQRPAHDTVPVVW